jgi:hypothetical protein
VPQFVLFLPIIPDVDFLPPPFHDCARMSAKQLLNPQAGQENPAIASTKCRCDALNQSPTHPSSGTLDDIIFNA